MSPRPIITLTTDFGLQDPYAGQMKGAILSLAPDVEIVDITHDIRPQAVLEGAFVLETSWRHFSEGTVHLVVVDPGVGTDRKRLVIQHGGHTFVGPDNGCLSAALPPAARGLRGPNAAYSAKRQELPADVVAYSIEDLSRLGRKPSPTFEGRDVFGPAAALVAGGGDPAGFGPRMASALAYPRLQAPASAGEVFGLVLRTDRFGNLITDIRADDAYPGSRFRISGRELSLAKTYAAADGLAAIAGSSGFVEIALPNGSAAAVLGAGAGERVVCITHSGRL